MPNILEKETWLIWSIEHDAWWGPKHRGYVENIDDAGLYDFEEAKKIVANANKFCKDKPNEAMIQFSPDL